MPYVIQTGTPDAPRYWNGRDVARHQDVAFGSSAMAVRFARHSDAAKVIAGAVWGDFDPRPVYVIVDHIYRGDAARPADGCIWQDEDGAPCGDGADKHF